MQGSSVYANYEGTGVGINFTTAQQEYLNYSFNYALLMLFLDFFIFAFLGLYLDKIIPSSYGKHYHPCFCLSPKFYGCGQRRRRRAADDEDDGDVEERLMGSEAADDNTFESTQMGAENYEAPPLICKRQENLGDFVRIEGLAKTYDGGFQAVRGVNFKMYENQIFALLGHNGAGKSTVISMLTGLIKKSQGSASVYGVDLFDDMDEVREFMGVCPQHDVLFDLLTPREHLDIFYDFKGGDPARKQEEIDSLIRDVGLTIDQNKPAYSLSGGNKRKLSVCIALCGGSKFVLFDEPTSGMDLGARRNLWDMLKKYKNERILVLTTHYMDEADVLGDRIGIMAKGRMMCLGSSLFLKNRFGTGYRITFVKKRKKAHPHLLKFLESYFTGVELSSEVHDEVSYVVPKSNSANFAGFFEQLDARLEEFDVSSYGVSMSNLEDVFLKINQEFAPDVFGGLKRAFDGSNASSSQNSDAGKYGGVQSIGMTESGKASKVDDSNNSLDSDEREAILEQVSEENLIRGSSCVRSCTAASAKRCIIYRRDICAMICQIVVPLTLVVLGLWITAGAVSIKQSDPRPLSTGWYPSPQRILMNEENVHLEGDGNDVSPKDILAKMPNSTDFFDVTWVANTTYDDFYN